MSKRTSGCDEDTDEERAGENNNAKKENEVKSRDEGLLGNGMTGLFSHLDWEDR
jgi:hypothetical protein